MAYAVLTRDDDGLADYAAALASLGLEAVALPVTRTEPPRDPDALARALQRGGYAAIACQSARAAAAVVAARRAPQRGALPGGDHDLASTTDVWALGPATARVLVAAGIPALVPADARDAAALARAMLASRPLAGRRVLVPRAEHGLDDAIGILRDAGVLVDDVIAYRTVAAPAGAPELARGLALLRDGAPCIVFAPSQVAALAALVDVTALRFAAIGETTAAALRVAGASVVAVAVAPTPAGIANAVATVYPPRS